MGWTRRNGSTILVCLATIGVCAALTMRSPANGSQALDLSVRSITLVNGAGKEVANLSSPPGKPSVSPV